MGFTRGKRILRDLVIQRIHILRDLSHEAIRRGDVELALVASNMIFRLSMRNSVRLPKEIKRGFCKRCKAPLIPGLTAMVRLRRKGSRKLRIVTCLLCWNIHRLELKQG
ncbi:MAG TPA: ribonuclease P Rpr2/Rpp21/SNM1 subunit [Sulfolobales archaeon]|nr:ribonuclease P Rpr2/Rpp21/SNM1 subunit [Sulfolobales archaeon]